MPIDQKYLVAHWQGRHGLLRSTLINGVISYVILIIALVTFGQIWQGPTDDHPVAPVIGMMGVLLLWTVWVFVGIVRSALNALGQGKPVFLKIGGAVVLIGVVTVMAFTVHDLNRLGLFH
jgi:hypothetical protein